MYRGDIRHHWQQICCSSRLYDGLFGEGCLRASANQARVLTWRPGRLEFELQAACRVCAHKQREKPFPSHRRCLRSALRHLYHSSLFHACNTPTHISPGRPSFNASRFVAKDTCTDPTASPSINMAYRIGMYIHSSQYYNASQDLLLIRPRNLRYQAGRLPGYSVQERKCQDSERRDSPGRTRHSRRLSEHEMASLVSDPCVI